MLTRLEVDGFKNLLGFSAEFGPFTCIAGANAVGKSNLFDAIEFLSLLATHRLNEAATKIRAVVGASGTGRELFWTNGEQRAERMRFAVEMIADGMIFDETLNHPVAPSGRYLRYELELGYQNGESPRLVLLHERLVILGDPARIRFPHDPSFVITQELERGRGRVIFDTSTGEGFKAERDSDIRRATRTILSIPDATEDRDTTLAARDELASWRLYSLEPSAIAQPDDFGHTSGLSSEGRHLPATLRSLDGHVEFDDDQQSVRLSLGGRGDAYRELAMRLSTITPIRAIEVDVDEARGSRSVWVTLKSGERVPARALSAGTLRFLALAVLGMSRAGLSCIEEPENGIHPVQIGELADLLTQLASDLNQTFEQDRHGTPPLRQAIVNTHSPPLVAWMHEHRPADILIATTALVRHAHGEPANTLRLHPLSGTWRCSETDRGIGTLLLAPYIGQISREPEP